METYIYVVLCGDCAYIGRTRNLKRRIVREHGHPPHWAVLETVKDTRRSNFAECVWMERFENMGVQLLNKTRASNGVHHLSAESRRLVSLANKGKIVSEETRRRMSAASKGIAKEWSEDAARRIARTQFKPGVSATPATQFRPGHKPANAFKLGMTPWNKGKPWSEEVKQKLRGFRKPIQHGTRSAYSNHGCRCDLCRAEYSRLNKIWFKQRQARAA